jgi:hypothetical protein
MLGQSHVFAEFCAGPEMFNGGVEVVVFDREQAEAHVHVGCTAETGVIGGVPQRRLEGALRVAQSSLGDLDVGECK